MKNRCIVRKYAAILALSLCSIITAFAQGKVTAYAHSMGPRNGQTLNNFPTNDQLDRIDYLIVTAIGVNNNGTLKFKDGNDNLPNDWNGNTNRWLQSLVTRAHSRGVNVSICISGGLEFRQAAYNPQRTSIIKNSSA